MTANEKMTLFDNLPEAIRKSILLKAGWDKIGAEADKNLPSLNICWHKQQKIKQVAINLQINI